MPYMVIEVETGDDRLGNLFGTTVFISEGPYYASAASGKVVEIGLEYNDKEEEE